MVGLPRLFDARPGARLSARTLTALLIAGCLLAVANPPASAQGWEGAAAVGLRVTDEDGQPIADAQVVARVSDADNLGPPPVATDAAGRAVVSGLRDGEWFIEVSHPGYMLFAAYVNLRAGKKPVVGFSSQVNTATSWSPMTVKFQKASADFRRSAPKRAEPKPPTVVRESPPPPPPRQPATVVRPEPEPPKVVRPEPKAEPEPEAPDSEESMTEPIAAETPTPEDTEPTETPPPVVAEPEVQEAQAAEPAPEIVETTGAEADPTPQVVESEPVPFTPEPVPSTEPKSEAPAPEADETAAESSPAEDAAVIEASAAVAETVEAAPVAPAPGPPIPLETPEREPIQLVSTESPADEPSESEPMASEPTSETLEPEAARSEPTPPAPTPAETEPTEAATSTTEPVEPEPTEPERVEPEPLEPAAVETEPLALEPMESESEETPVLEPTAVAPPPEEVPETEAPAPERTTAPPAPQTPITAPTTAARMPRFLRSAAAGNCSECQPGEWAVAAEQESARAGDTPATSACTDEYLATAREAAQQLADAPGERLDGYVGPMLTAMFRLDDGSGRDAIQDRLGSVTDPESNCQMAGIVLPRGTTFSGYVLEAWDNLGGRGCRAGMTCAVGRARWLDEPEVVVGAERSVVYSIFKNRSTRRPRRLRMTIYFTPDTEDWAPRTR